MALRPVSKREAGCRPRDRSASAIDFVPGIWRYLVHYSHLEQYRVIGGTPLHLGMAIPLEMIPATQQSVAAYGSLTERRSGACVPSDPAWPYAARSDDDPSLRVVRSEQPKLLRGAPVTGGLFPPDVRSADAGPPTPSAHCARASASACKDDLVIRGWGTETPTASDYNPTHQRKSSMS